jgi:hypothetical protein
MFDLNNLIQLIGVVCLIELEIFVYVSTHNCAFNICYYMIDVC